MIALLLAALTLAVTPQVSFSPATVRAKVQIDPSDRPQTLFVALISDDFEQQTELPIAPSTKRQTIWIAPWVRVPVGVYQVFVALSRDGKVIAAQRLPVQVQPGLGGQ